MAKIKIGPFSPFDVDSVERIFTEQKISYEMHVDEEVRNERVAEHNEAATLSPRESAGSFNNTYVFFDVEEDDIAKIGHRLEKLGWIPRTDGSELNVNEFVCPQCKFRDYDIQECMHCKRGMYNVDSPEGQKALAGEVGVWTPEKIFLVVLFVLGSVFRIPLYNQLST